MIVVSNTSPLNYLVLVDAIGVLAPLYGEVYLPPMVITELTHAGSPPAVRRWASSLPGWVLVRTPSRVDPGIRLHAGEAQAIALAQEIGAGIILMDERLGRKAARDRGITPVGILGVLYEAAGLNLINLEGVVGRLTSATNFHCDKKLVDDLLRRHAAREGRLS